MALEPPITSKTPSKSMMMMMGASQNFLRSFINFNKSFKKSILIQFRNQAIGNNTTNHVCTFVSVMHVVVIQCFFFCHGICQIDCKYVVFFAVV